MPGTWHCYTSKYAHIDIYINIFAAVAFFVVFNNKKLFSNCTHPLTLYFLQQINNNATRTTNNGRVVAGINLPSFGSFLTTTTIALIVLSLWYYRPDSNTGYPRQAAQDTPPGRAVYILCTRSTSLCLL